MRKESPKKYCLDLWGNFWTCIPDYIPKIVPKMLPNFPYMAMTITGVMHSILGITVFLDSCIEFREDQSPFPWFIFLGVLVASSIWIMIVGLLGVLAGRKSFESRKTHKLKIAYMVTSILAAALFSVVSISSATILHDVYLSGIFRIICCSAEFILSIVTSSICCCCANSNQSPAGVVFVQAPPGTNPEIYLPSYTGIDQTPQEGLTNPGYQLNSNSSPEYPTEKEVV